MEWQENNNAQLIETPKNVGLQCATTHLSNIDSEGDQQKITTYIRNKLISKTENNQWNRHGQK